MEVRGVGSYQVCKAWFEKKEKMVVTYWDIDQSSVCVLVVYVLASNWLLVEGLYHDPSSGFFSLWICTMCVSVLYFTALLYCFCSYNVIKKVCSLAQ